MVLARYNTVGKATAVLVAAGGLLLPILAAILWFLNGAQNGPLIACVAVAWLGTLPGLAAALRALSNILRRESRAVFVEDGRLHYVAPGMFGSLSLAPADIVHARTTTRKRYQSNAVASAQVKPVWVVEIGRKAGKPRDIAVYALDVSPETLAGRVTAFADGKVEGDAPSIVQ